MAVAVPGRPDLVLRQPRLGQLVVQLENVDDSLLCVYLCVCFETTLLLCLLSVCVCVCVCVLNLYVCTLYI